MNDHAKQVPPVERPQDHTDDTLEKLEANTLDKQASSASFRAVLEHDRHLRSLYERIEVLQKKLDDREDELRAAVPRVAELEQAERTTRVGAGVEAVGAGGGAILLSIAAFASAEWLKYLLLGLGASAAALSVISKLLYATFGWPPNKKSLDKMPKWAKLTVVMCVVFSIIATIAATIACFR